MGAIADAMLNDHAKQQVASILGVPLQTAGPWLDCVKSVHRQENGTFKYIEEAQFEPPCRPFKDARDLMEAYVGRNFVQCSYLTHRDDHQGHEFDEEMGCHNTYHFDDIAIQHDHFDRNFQGTNDHDIVAAINAAIAVLLERPSPPPFKIATKTEALFMLAHLLGDLHQPLHVGAAYLEQGRLVDPDVTHTIDPATETIGGNIIFDNDKGFHGAWDAPPTGMHVTDALTLLPQAQAVPKDTGRIEDWSFVWATDTLKVAPQAFAGATYARVEPDHDHRQGGWDITFPNHAEYVKARDALKKEQLAKAGARLANLLNTIWP